jgi:hypothetical protein
MTHRNAKRDHGMIIGQNPGWVRVGRGAIKAIWAGDPNEVRSQLDGFFFGKIG